MNPVRIQPVQTQSRCSITVTIPISTMIPETPMAECNEESIQESSEDSTSPNSIQVFHHVLNNILKIKEYEVASFQNWMSYLGYHNFLDLCLDFLPDLNDIYSCSCYTVEGQQCALKFDTINQLRMSINWG